MPAQPLPTLTRMTPATRVANLVNVTVVTGVMQRRGGVVRVLWALAVLVLRRLAHQVGVPLTLVQEVTVRACPDREGWHGVYFDEARKCLSRLEFPWVFRVASEGLFAWSISVARTGFRCSLRRRDLARVALQREAKDAAQIDALQSRRCDPSGQLRRHDLPPVGSSIQHRMHLRRVPRHHDACQQALVSCPVSFLH